MTRGRRSRQVRIVELDADDAWEPGKLAAQLEQHVKDYEVEVMNLQTATALVPASAPGATQPMLPSSIALGSSCDSGSFIIVRCIT